MNSDDLLTKKCELFSHHARLCKPMYNLAEKKNIITIDRIIGFIGILISIILSDYFITTIKFVITHITNMID